MTIFWGLMIPFIGTTLGALCVLFIKNELKPVIQKSLLGFAAGVMVAASVWSLLIPAMEMSDHLGQLAFLPAAVGFLVGIVFLLALDRLIPHLHLGSEESEGPKASLKKSTMLILAVTIHNIPEGISGGAVFAGLLMNNSKVTLLLIDNDTNVKDIYDKILKDNHIQKDWCEFHDTICTHNGKIYYSDLFIIGSEYSVTIIWNELKEQN